MRKNSSKGKLIVFEGLDGSGQSTQAKLLQEFLAKQGKLAALTKEPTKDSDAGKRIRQILDKKETISPKEFQELFAKDRREHLGHSIIPALREGIWVISDRYFFTSFAYGAAEGVDLEYLIEINNEFLLPDASFFLKVSPEICVERIKNRGKPFTYFEKRDHFEKAGKIFELLAKRSENMHIINGEQSIEKVAQDVRRILIETLKAV